MQKLAPTAERPVVNSALKQLDACYRDVMWGSMTHLGYPNGKTNIPYTPHLLAECFDWARPFPCRFVWLGKGISLQIFLVE